MKAALTAIVLIATLSDSVEAQKKKKGPSYGCKWQDAADGVKGGMRFIEKTKKRTDETKIKQGMRVKGLEEGEDYHVCLSEPDVFTAEDIEDLADGTFTCQDLVDQQSAPTMFGEFDVGANGRGKVRSRCVNTDYLTPETAIEFEGLDARLATIMTADDQLLGCCILEYKEGKNRNNDGLEAGDDSEDSDDDDEDDF